MGFHAGIDIIELAEVREALDAHGERYLRRVLTPAERAAAAGRTSRIAATLAAKEATFKALHVPADAPAVWQDVEIIPPQAVLRGALRRAHPHAQVKVSGSSDRSHALAVVIVEER